MLVLAVLAGGLVACQAGDRQAQPVAYRHLDLSRDGTGHGTFDPSLAYDDKGIGWLAFSAIHAPEFVETHIASSRDAGATWQVRAQVNRSAAGTAEVAGKATKGAWRYETPALLYDPGDRPDRRWKLISHRYFTLPPYKPKNRHFKLGWIAMQTAPAPDGPWSADRCLIGIGIPDCAADPQTLHPNLSDAKVMIEPGAIVAGGMIYLSFEVSRSPTGLGDWQAHRTVLLASADHGRNWRYVAAMITNPDAEALGYRVLTGGNLARQDGRVFFLASPSGRRGLFRKNRGHDGVLVFEFADLARGILRRDSAGRLIVRRTVPIAGDSGGLGTFHERNTAGGLVVAQIFRAHFPDVFQIHSTGITRLAAD